MSHGEDDEKTNPGVVAQPLRRVVDHDLGDARREVAVVPGYAPQPAKFRGDGGSGRNHVVHPLVRRP